ncbi:MAG: hypothetical protein WKF75_06170 [Singulisphaera sp.]
MGPAGDARCPGGRRRAHRSAWRTSLEYARRRGPDLPLRSWGRRRTCRSSRHAVRPARARERCLRPGRILCVLLTGRPPYAAPILASR